VTAGPQATATHGATAHPTTQATASEGATAAPTPGQFVCANPQGSSLTYAYVRGDGNLYAVTGCGQPRPLVTGNRYPGPVAWSSSNRYLAVDLSSSQGPGDAITIVDVQTGQSVPTSYMLAGIGFAGNLNPGQTAKLFLGWLNDDLFVAANVPLLDGPTGSNTGPATIVTVDRTTQKETKVGTVTWFADAKVRAGRYLFYGGYQSKSEGGAYLHRLDVITGQDTKGVPLGLAGPGPCQGTPYCNWTAPWDVTADGSHVIWHKPGPAGTPSDTYTPPDTPLVYSSFDGSNASTPFGSELADGMTSPVLSPDGAYVAAWGVHAAGKPAGQPPFITIVHVSGGTPMQVTASGFVWRADSAALQVDTGTSAVVRQLYTLGGAANMTLEENSGSYLWGN
jgi:hypothetical protein